MGGGMKTGLSLVELLIAMAAASLLMLVLYHLQILSNAIHIEMKDEWYCMQSLRGAAVQLNDDLTQCACLLPQDLKVALDGSELFIAGVPVTSQHPGIRPSPSIPPPYYSIVVSSTTHDLVLDAIDIDGDSRADFWADLGMITEAGPCLISHEYSRGNPTVTMVSSHAIAPGNRVVPAIHYELKADGLYRNSQLLAEAIVHFEPRLGSGELVVVMRARHHGTEKELSIPYPL
jgi:prepilin-type N-terminal cleavage/methylation domain-containing protein